MANLNSTTIFLILYGILQCMVEGRPSSTVAGGGTNNEEVDSYAIIPSKQQQTNSDVDIPPSSELNLEMVPPSITLSSPPHIYYMNEDGIAKPAEYEQIPAANARQHRRRRAVKNVLGKQSRSESEEIMDTAQTIIIQPPSKNYRPFGYSPFVFAIRPAKQARSRYARRYHKYPWNYHRR